MPTLGTAWAITYKDTNGNVSSRRVRFSGLTQSDGHLIVQGFCYERNAPRSFRTDRIVDLWDLTTGETYEDVYAFFDEAFENDQIIEPLREAVPGLNVMIALAWADDDFHVMEHDTILNYALEETDGSVSAEWLEKHIRALRPDDDLFQLGLQAIENWPDERIDRFWQLLKILVDADGRVDEREVELLAEIEAELRTA